MPPNYLLGIFHWREHAGELDGMHSAASLRTLLWACERWLELNPAAEDNEDRRRLIIIKGELEDWFVRIGADD